MNQDRYEFLLSYVLDKPEFKELFNQFLVRKTRNAAFNEFEATCNMAVISFIRELLDNADNIAKQTSKEA